MKFVKLLFCICFLFSLTHVVFGANYTVTKIEDTNDGTCDADCSLREAVAAGNATAANDTIYFALPLFASPQTITLMTGEIVVANNGSLTIYGTGANRLTIFGNNFGRLFVSGANVVVNLHHMRFSGGNGVGTTNSGRGGAIYNVGGTMLITNSIITGNQAANGGALNNAASTGPAVPANLTLINCWVTNNMATSSGSAMQNFSTSTLHLRNTAVTNNTTSSTGIAGAIQANGTVTITNSTFSGNTAPAGTGGGVYYNGLSMIMTNSTLVGNSSNLGGGGLHRTGTNPTLIMRNTIVANNTGAAASPDAAGLVTSEGNNIIGNIGTSTGWVGSDLQNMNPMLAPLGFYGGIGYSHAPLTVSPAINGGQNCVTDASCATNNPPVAIPKDQRGASRAGNVDIGAFETNSAYAAILRRALVNEMYNHTLAPNVGAFTYSHSGGTLPPGVTVNTGAVIASVSGTPTEVGVFSFGVSIADTMNSTTQAYRLFVSNDPLLVPVSGRVTDAAGNGISKATVVLTDQNGNTRFAGTNGFGYYYFGDIPVGTTYTASVSSKQYTFAPNVVTIVDYIDDLDFIALP